jgi:hypothetical protein
VEGNVLELFVLPHNLYAVNGRNYEKLQVGHPAFGTRIETAVFRIPIRNTSAKHLTETFSQMCYSRIEHYEKEAQMYNLLRAWTTSGGTKLVADQYEDFIPRGANSVTLFVVPLYLANNCNEVTNAPFDVRGAVLDTHSDHSSLNLASVFWNAYFFKTVTHKYGQVAISKNYKSSKYFQYFGK